eukprot:9461812-Alexandrium_andersonii.AAC.1
MCIRDRGKPLRRAKAGGVETSPRPRVAARARGARGQRPSRTQRRDAATAPRRCPLRGARSASDAAEGPRAR